jgi:hypothetical protein
MNNNIIATSLKNEGRKLGYLLKESNFSDKLKLEIVNLVEDMSSKQIKRLIDILEAQYMDVNTKNIDEKFIKENK